MANENYIIGSVSSGTMRNEDLIPAFVDALRKLAPNDDGFLDSVQGRIDEDEDGNYFDSEDANFDLDELFARLNKQAPPYFYFGENEGDGADYGFWFSKDAIRDDFDGLRVDDTSDVPDDYTGEVLHVNDHGNMSLYAAKDGELTEIWAIV